ncbi:uncharacterized protein AMSG_10291 [Thecamonas trahens ATCC 50062]|uniref:Uncharacterized protein n=1 Tax=Thecamonas trahens ATCC 50062 TaxID=461836 RepID=A0A0L0DPT4_THETB|nr:hypothetical protein AMSG_10291 [Thecamonas trahens ATCC 50062]KNC54307.1 hypothetical protein AMSG_10291 [Thecamonas trahens ATCC 50062]|eukprot:XP_013753768.1 hypothetical protein AMSG_10291 [Thecamonas trahens ATCC 50062]
MAAHAESTELVALLRRRCGDPEAALAACRQREVETAVGLCRARAGCPSIVADYEACLEVHLQSAAGGDAAASQLDLMAQHPETAVCQAEASKLSTCAMAVAQLVDGAPAPVPRGVEAELTAACRKVNDKLAACEARQSRGVVPAQPGACAKAREAALLCAGRVVCPADTAALSACRTRTLWGWLPFADCEPATDAVHRCLAAFYATLAKRKQLNAAAGR